MPGSELLQRVAVAAVGIPLAVAVIHAGGWILGGLLALIAAGGTLELYRLSDRCGVRAFVVPGALAAAAIVAVGAWRQSVASAAPPLFGLTLVLILAAGAAAVWARGVEGKPLFAASVTVFGAAFTGWTLVHALFLRHELAAALDSTPTGAPAFLSSTAWVGAALVIFAVGVTWINDTSAYFAGRAWGRRKLMPRVSPGKTVVGAVAGIVGAVVAGAAYAGFVLGGWYGLPIGPVGGAIGAALIAVVAQVGDLAESVIKREAGVKDSGHLLPGHGGILDRFDALFFTLPAAYWYLAAVLGTVGGPW